MESIMEKAENLIDPKERSEEKKKINVPKRCCSLVLPSFNTRCTIE